jgi:hypothetical protein
MPDLSPVVMPMFACGHLFLHASISVLLLVASLSPCGVSGCFPGWAQLGPSGHEQWPLRLSILLRSINEP